MIRINLREKYGRVEVRSVDGYQGREKEAVILSLVRSNSSFEVGFLAERRRLNVAVTRARRQVIVICDSETIGTDPFLKAFIDYLSEHGTVEDPNMYPDLPNITRPDELITHADHGAVNSNEQSGKKAKKKEVLSSTTGKVPDKKTAQPKKKEMSLKPESNGSEEESIKSKYSASIKKFVNSKEDKVEFSSDLDSFERRIVHQLAEEMGLLHQSLGEGKERRIVLQKKPRESSTSSHQGAEAEARSCSEIEIRKVNERNVNIIQCSNCNQDIPKDNLELHLLRCRVSIKEIDQKPKSKKKNEKKTKKSKTNNDDDFDILCEEMHRMNSVCNFDDCKTKVSVIGVNCSYCTQRFCLQHSMAEIHGCGAAAKLAARRQICKDGKSILSGIGAQSIDPTKRVHLQRKLDKKIGTLSDDRKGKKTKT